MSKHNRTSRRRRTALRLGATGGGLLAAAFMPMGIALAQTTGTTVGDPGLYPADTETVPDPFSDLTGVADGTAANPGVTAADAQLNADNPALAAQIDYDIDNNEPFSFATLDGIPAEPSGYTDATATTDLDPFEDALPAGSSATEVTNATSYDYALNQLLTPAEVTQLDSIADGSTTTVVPPTDVPFPLADNDPAVDFVQLFDPSAVSPVSGAPNDIFGEFATLDDQFLNAFGLGAPLDQFEDLFTGSFTNATTEALGGLGSSTGDLLGGLTGTGGDFLTGVGGTGADFFTNILTDLAGSF